MAVKQKDIGVEVPTNGELAVFGAMQTCCCTGKLVRNTGLTLEYRVVAPTTGLHYCFGRAVV